MDIYKSYTENIRSAINNDHKRETINLSYSATDKLRSTEVRTRLLDETRKTAPLSSLQSIADELGLRPDFTQKLGAHPDFSHLKDSGNIEKHYIHSMFIDIKGSTNLFRRYEPETVLIITNTIQRAAIHTCVMFGGYIQRLHGDGMFVYFGGRNETRAESAARCLTAASLFTYFVKNDLRELFSEQGIETIFTRIGIDSGENHEVVWAMAGIAEMSEITTCSLHTSLAAKMQNYAASNGIVAGANIRNLTKGEFFTPVCQRTGLEKDRYIFTIPEEKFYYTQYDFDWLSHLKSLEYITTNATNGSINIKRKAAGTLGTAGLYNVAAKSQPYSK
jgi:adenylate cyclase